MSRSRSESGGQGAGAGWPGAQRDLPHTHPSLLYRLLKLSNLIGRPFFAHFADRYDLTMNDLRVLMTLAPMSEAASHELCQVTGMHPMNVSRSVARLRRQGRIAERSDPTNRRRKILRPTPAGLDLYLKLTPHVKVISEFLFETMSREDAEFLSKLVDRLTDRLEAVDLNSPLLIDAEALAQEAGTEASDRAAPESPVPPRNGRAGDGAHRPRHPHD